MGSREIRKVPPFIGVLVIRGVPGLPESRNTNHTGSMYIIGGLRVPQLITGVHEIIGQLRVPQLITGI